MNRKILRLAIPNVISNISVPLLGLLDIGLMGHMGSQSYIGAIAIGTMIFNFMFWAFGFLRMGSSGFTAQAYGRRDMPEILMILVRSLLLAFIIGVLLIILQIPIGYFSFKLLNAGSEVEKIAAQYFYIRIYSAPATLALYALLGWFIGMQDAKTPLIIAVFVNLINMAYSIFFIKVMGMKADGIALGSMLAQYSGLLLALWMLYKYYGKLFKHFSIQKLKLLKPFLNFLYVNQNIFIRTMLLIFTFTFFTSRSAALGDDILSGNTLLYQFLIFFSYFMDGFAFAAESLVGKYYGAADKMMLKKTVKRLFLWGACICLFFTVFYYFLGRLLLPVLTNNIPSLQIANHYFYWVYLLPIATFAAFLWDGIYIGCTASVAMRNSMIVSVLILFFPLYFLVFKSFGNDGLWLSFLIFLASRGVLLQLFSGKYIFPTKKYFHNTN